MPAKQTQHEKVSAEDVNSPRPKLLRGPPAQAWPKPRTTGAASSWERFSLKGDKAARVRHLSRKNEKMCYDLLDGGNGAF